MLNRIIAWPIAAHAVATGLALAGFVAVKAWLDASYAASGHPVDYATGQTSFSADRVMDWYAQMQAGGTLGVYWWTQVIDYAFMATIALLGVFLGTLVARLSPQGSPGRRLGLLAAVLAVAGAAMDAVENLLSFAMLARPEAVPQLLAVAYSGFAVAKFALLTLAMLALGVSLVIGLTLRLLRR